MIQIKPDCPYLKEIIAQHKRSRKDHKKCRKDCYVPNSIKCGFVLSLEEATLFMVGQHFCGICCGKQYNPKYSTPMAQSEGYKFDAKMADHLLLSQQSETLHSIFPYHQMSSIVNNVARNNQNACLVFEKMIKFETNSIGNLKNMLVEVLKEAEKKPGQIDDYVKFCLDHEDQLGCLIAQAIREQMVLAIHRYKNEIVPIFKIIDKLVTNGKTYGPSFTFDIPNWYDYAYQYCSEAEREFFVNLRQNWDSIFPRATMNKIDSEIMKHLKKPETDDKVVMSYLDAKFGNSSNVDGSTVLKENENEKTGNPGNDDSFSRPSPARLNNKTLPHNQSADGGHFNPLEAVSSTPSFKKPGDISMSDADITNDDLLKLKEHRREQRKKRNPSEGYLTDEILPSDLSSFTGDKSEVELLAVVGPESKKEKSSTKENVNPGNVVKKLSNENI